MKREDADELDAAEDDVDLGLAAAGGAEGEPVEAEPHQRRAGEQVERELAQLGEDVGADAVLARGAGLDRQQQAVRAHDEQRVVVRARSGSW